MSCRTNSCTQATQQERTSKASPAKTCFVDLLGGKLTCFAECRRAIGLKILIYPSSAIFAGLTIGILLFYEKSSPVFYTALCLLLFWPILAKQSLQNLSKFFVSVLAGFLLSWNTERNASETCLGKSATGDFGAEIRAQIVDSSAIGAGIPWMPSPSPVKAKVKEIRFSKFDSWKKSSGLLAIYPTKDAPRLSYGDQIVATGALTTPATAVFDGDFDYSKYLKTKKIHKIFSCADLSIDDNATATFAPLRKILEFRNFCMTKICDGIRDDTNKKILAGIIFGCRQGIDQKSKKDFLLGGMVHVFAVSGLHVGMVATIAFWSLRPFPFRIRHVLIIPLIFLYVMTTGFQPSAVRAGLMICLWSALRAFFVPAAALNSIFIAASLILAFNPFALFDIGFQFSFIIVAFLALSWDRSREISEMIFERRRLVPPSLMGLKFLFKARIANFALQSLLASTVAWLASLPLGIFYQGISAPAAVPANFASIPFVWLIFVVSIAKFAVFPIPILSDFASFLLGFLMNSTRWIAETASIFADGQFFAPPRLSIIAIYYLLLLALVTARRTRVFAFFASSFIFLVFGWIFHETFKRGNTEVAIFYGGACRSPMLVMAERGNSFALNAPSTEAARAALNWLKKRGVGNIDEITFCEPTKDFLAGANFLVSSSSVSRISMPDGWRKSYFARRTAQTAFEKRCLLTGDSSVRNRISLRNSQNGTEESWELHPNMDEISRMSIKKFRDGEWSLEILLKGGEVMSWQMPLQNKFKIKEIKINERDRHQRLLDESFRQVGSGMATPCLRRF